MKEITLQASKRTETGKKYTKKIRKSELVPGVLYGGENPIIFEIADKELRRIIYTNKVFFVKLNIEGQVYSCIKKDVQFHPVTDKILHVDFLTVSEDKPVKMFVPVELVGFSKGVQAGGHLFRMKRYLNISAFMKDIPDVLKVDVTELDLGKSYKIEDLKFDNIEVHEPKSDVVAMVKLTRAAMSRVLEEQKVATEAEIADIKKK